MSENNKKFEIGLDGFADATIMNDNDSGKFMKY
jgi:hypothetical protein